MPICLQWSFGELQPLVFCQIVEQKLESWYCYSEEGICFFGLKNNLFFEKLIQKWRLK